ncbi:MAG: MATE family efflux transporter [Pseudomonadales bacterium]|jgi:putative MATE family efflux protein|nr:MATE family efflux transporter [Pseudomonadales bacterium]
MSKKDLTQGSVTASLAKLTAPMVMGVSSSILVQTLEMGFIGQLSTQHLAAVTFTFPLVMILTSIALGISIGTSSVIARSVGGGQDSEVRRLGTHSLILVAAIMLILSGVAWVLINPIFTAMGASPEAIALIHSYLDIYLPGTVLFTLTMIASSIMRASGNANIPGIVMTVGALFNLLLDPFLIFGWLFFPRMELAGAATAMTITRVFTCAVLFYYVYTGNMMQLHQWWQGFIKSAKRIMHVGIPAMATQLIGPVTAAMITGLLAQHGETVVAGFGVAGRIEAVAVMILFALSGSIGPFVGQNWGAKQFARVRDGVNVSYRFCIVWGFFAAIPLFFFGPSIVALIDDAPTVIGVAAFYLAVVPWSYSMWGVLMMASASFNALGKPLPSTALSFMRMFVIYLPLALLLNDAMGYEGIFIATLISNILLGIAAWLWFRLRLLEMSGKA